MVKTRFAHIMNIASGKWEFIKWVKILNVDMAIFTNLRKQTIHIPCDIAYELDVHKYRVSIKKWGLPKTEMHKRIISYKSKQIPVIEQELRHQLSI